MLNITSLVIRSGWYRFLSPCEWNSIQPHSSSLLYLDFKQF